MALLSFPRMSPQTPSVLGLQRGMAYVLEVLAKEVLRER